MTRYLTARERQTKANAAAAVARALAHAKPPPAPDHDQALGEQFGYITHARARAIRIEIQEDRNARP